MEEKFLLLVSLHPIDYSGGSVRICFGTNFFPHFVSERQFLLKARIVHRFETLLLPLVSAFSAWIQFLGKVAQVVIVVEIKQLDQIRAKLDSPHAVAQFVKRWRPAHDSHHVGHDQQDASGNT